MKKQMITLCSLFLMGSALGVAAHAESRAADKPFKRSYGLAGCGLGAMAFGDEPGKVQIFAATLNNAVSPQTSALTSGTSNCWEDSSQVSSMFINVNKQALKKDIADGNGEALVSLSQLLGCSDHDKLGSALQENYAQIFPTEEASATDIYRSIQTTIQNNQELKKGCTTVI